MRLAYSPESSACVLRGKEPPVALAPNEAAVSPSFLAPASGRRHTCRSGYIGAEVLWIRSVHTGSSWASRDKR